MQNKEIIIQALAKKLGLSKRQAAEALNVVFDEITKSLSRGQEVKLIGFGKFSVKERQGKKLPKFKAGQVLKSAVK